MPVFAKLRALRAFHKRHLAVLETVEDFDLVFEIGFHQERGEPLTMKRLHLLGLGSIATLQRRLRRLREAGVVVSRRSSADARSVELMISARVAKAFARLCEVAESAAEGLS